MARRQVPTGPSLADAYLKTSRARVHIDCLDKQLRAFYDSKPYTFFGKEDTKKSRYIIRFDLRQPPDGWWLIFGDAVNCLRAALDHTVFALASINRKTPYPEGTRFPIFDIPLNSERRKQFRRMTTNVPAAAVAIIKRLQPYHRLKPQTHLLSTLNALGNIDKHRRVPMHGQIFEFNFPNVPVDLIKPVLVVDHKQQMLSVPIQFKGYMSLNPKMSNKVIFGDMAVGAECDFDRIFQIYEFVAHNVIPRFARFFK
jgi:hypothetical protein